MLQRGVGQAKTPSFVALCGRDLVLMEDPFPLSLPTGTSAVSLPWRDRNIQGWIVEATAEGGQHQSTWKFGKVSINTSRRWITHEPLTERRLRGMFK